MQQGTYNSPEMDVVELLAADVICESTIKPKDPDETEITPG